MRSLRPGPTLSTEVNSLPMPSLGLPRGPEPRTHLAGLLQGSWSRELCLWEMVTFLCCPHSQELEAKSGTASPAWTGKGEPWDPLPIHIPCFPAGGSGIHRQLDKEPAFGAEYRSKVRDPGGHRVGGMLPRALLGQEAPFVCWVSGPVASRLEGISAPRGVAKHSVPVNVSSLSWSPCPALAVASSCALLKAGVCSIIWVGNQLPGPRA